ncbi:MAG: lamin tail domain-containing protein [Candidatus Colwellbacteria bacterium]|nr:lamin tail domain-containing protein [Candidatus Colwellbacteria bacterium]
MVYIESLLPNPIGQDTGNEWIRIANSGDGTEDVSGWRIEDNGGAVFSLNSLGAIKPGENVEVKQTGISLNNSGDKISLYDKQGATIDQLGYDESVAEGEIVFSGRFLPEQQNTVEEPLLANVAESGIVNGHSLSAGAFEPFLLGVLTAVLSTAVFIYLQHSVFSRHE